MFADLRALDRSQRAVLAASFLGWTLDAFDYFLLTFVVTDIAREFQVAIGTVAEAIFLTLAMRPLGALVFGLLAERFGRKPILMLDILLYSGFELATAFSSSIEMLLVFRALFGFAMGGEWGLGASLAFETIPARARGIVSGILQEGYAVGNLLAAIVFWTLYDQVGWRGMFVIGVLPALLVIYLRFQVEESPVWLADRGRAEAGFLKSLVQSVRGRLGLFVYVILLMACFNALSHGSQDLFPTFLRVEHGLGPQPVGAITIAANVGAITGGVLFGLLSERIGRRRAIILAAVLVPLVVWTYGVVSGPATLALAAFVVQVLVQGAFGIVPVHLNELSPEGARGTFPGVAYQLGNLLVSRNQVFQAQFAAANGGRFGLALAALTGLAALAVALVTWLGPERKGVAFAGQDKAGSPSSSPPAGGVGGRL